MIMKGDRYSTRDKFSTSSSTTIEVIGGPTRLTIYGFQYFWTIRVIECPDPEKINRTYVLREDEFRSMNFVENIRSVHRNVVVAHCPECDEPDMIFYGEDYICAWCREHLEE